MAETASLRVALFNLGPDCDWLGHYVQQQLVSSFHPTTVWFPGRTYESQCFSVCRLKKEKLEFKMVPKAITRSGQSLWLSLFYLCYSLLDGKALPCLHITSAEYITCVVRNGNCSLRQLLPFSSFLYWLLLRDIHSSFQCLAPISYFWIVFLHAWTIKVSRGKTSMLHRGICELNHSAKSEKTLQQRILIPSMLVQPYRPLNTWVSNLKKHAR